MTKSGTQQITRRALLAISVEARGETTFCKESKGKFGAEAWSLLQRYADGIG